jgi:hypothetical protein
MSSQLRTQLSTRYSCPKFMRLQVSSTPRHMARALRQRLNGLQVFWWLSTRLLSLHARPVVQRNTSITGNQLPTGLSSAQLVLLVASADAPNELITNSTQAASPPSESDSWKGVASF